MLSAFAEGSLFGERHGAGPPAVVALHGWGRSRHDFAAVLEGIPSVALDLPGFGSSPPPPEPWGSRGYGEAVAAVLEELLSAGDGERDGGIVVLGHSFGGNVAVQLAASRPDLVAALVLAGTPRLVAPDEASRSRPRPKAAFRLFRAAHRAGLVGPAAMERARQRYGSADYRAASGVMREVLVRVLAEDLEPELRALRCPVRLVWGELDSAAPVSSARRAAELLGPAARLDVLAGIGHLVPLDKPGALRRALSDLLGGPSGAAAPEPAPPGEPAPAGTGEPAPPGEPAPGGTGEQALGEQAPAGGGDPDATALPA